MEVLSANIIKMLSNLECLKEIHLNINMHKTKSIEETIL